MILIIFYIDETETVDDFDHICSFSWRQLRMW